jgi:hypothetical protein
MLFIIKYTCRLPVTILSMRLLVTKWLFVCALLISLRAGAQPTPKLEPFVLKAAALGITPQEFYIADVLDEREDRRAVAYLLQPAPLNPANAPLVTIAQPVDLQGGGLAAIRQFVRQSLPRATNLRPLVMRVKECRVTETAGPAKGRIDGTVKVHIAFDYLRDNKYTRLVEYRGGARYSRPAGQLTVVEPTLRQALAGGLRYINTWMNQQADNNEILAKGLQVHFTDYTPKMADDTVFYSVNRLLTWNDFTAKPRAGRYAALVFPSFAYEGGSEVRNGIIHLNLKLKVYVLQSSSWVKDVARDAYSLNHEQRHFDIVKLVAERFKQKIHPDSLTLEDYNSMVQYKFIESFREMNRMQEQYDGETQHGINQAAQAAWNQRIEADLRKYGVKK